MLNSRKHNIKEVTSKKSGRTIGVEEPIFLLRAQDDLSLAVLSYYFSLCSAQDQKNAIGEVHADFTEWQLSHSHLVKESKA